MDSVIRIFELLDEAGLEQKVFAGLIGTTDKTVSAWKTGRSKSYTKCIPQIAEVLNSTTEYLLTGNGPKHKETEPSAPKDAGPGREDMIEVSPEQAQVLLAYEQADPALRDIVRRALGLK